MFLSSPGITNIGCDRVRIAIPLLEGQGCIAGPKNNWVGIYWVGPTLMYSASFGLALLRSFQSRAARPITLWKLMLRDGLNLYGAIWIVNMVNMFFWFIVTPTGPDDSIKTIVTSMAAVLTTSMTLRIILSVRGSLVYGGSFAGASTAATGTSRSTHVITTNRSHGGVGPVHTYDLSQVSKVAEGGGGEWNLSDSDGKSSVNGPKGILPVGSHGVDVGRDGVKITIDQEVEYDTYPRAK
jgi:hypothetical protein